MVPCCNSLNSSVLVCNEQILQSQKDNIQQTTIEPNNKLPRKQIKSMINNKNNQKELVKYETSSTALSLYASGSTTSIVLDLGDGNYVSQAVMRNIMRLILTGSDVIEYLQKLFTEREFLYTITAKEIVSDIKEKLYYIVLEQHLKFIWVSIILLVNHK
eukprot:45767_1